MISNIIAGSVGVICLLLLVLTLVGVGAAVPAWVVYLLIGAVAGAIILHPR